MTQLDRDEFERLVADQQELVRLVNDLEYRLYLLGDPQDDRVAGCRDTAVALITRLREVLFRWDQSVMPQLEPPSLHREGQRWT
jgi:hypothetical protein